jgi:hypothetical protein
MKPVPETDNTLLLRTDFSDDAAWERLCAAIQAPVGEFRASVTPASERSFDGASVDEVLERLADETNHSFLFLADRVALTNPEQPVLVVDLIDRPARTFRVIPSEAWSVENNLSIANMDFEEFADAVDEDGVFRGFPGAERSPPK